MWLYTYQDPLPAQSSFFLCSPPHPSFFEWSPFPPTTSLSTPPIIFIAHCLQSNPSHIHNPPHSCYCYYHQQSVSTIVAIPATALLSFSFVHRIAHFPPRSCPIAVPCKELFIMSENQSSPPAPDPSAFTTGYLPDADALVESIEDREMLSPVSPHPVHVAEPSDIPVLMNQMDPVFNSTDVHTSHPAVNGLGLGGLPYSLGSSLSWMEQQPQSQHLSMSSASATDNTNDSIPSSSSSSSSSLTADVLHNALPSAIANFGNGNVPDTSGTNGVMMNTSLVTAESTSASPPKTHSYSLPSNIPNNVDLQALLTKLSPSVQQPVSSQIAQASSAAIAATTVAALVPAHASSPSQARVPSLPQPPMQAPVPSQPPAQNHQTTHPLPQPPATSAVNGAPGHTGHPAGYPASLPPPPNFNQHRQQVPASPTGTEDNEEDNRPFTIEEEEAYERFLSDERDYVTQGQWDRFPAGSRLFIGAHPQFMHISLHPATPIDSTSHILTLNP